MKKRKENNKNKNLKDDKRVKASVRQCKPMPIGAPLPLEKTWTDRAAKLADWVGDCERRGRKQENKAN